jgi:metalloendopeptidase OMA1, mitochondrial
MSNNSPVRNNFRLLPFLLFIIVTSCAPRRPLIPVGVIPRAERVRSTDYEYGQTVLSQLNQRFPISRNPYFYDRVKQIVNRLTTGARATAEPWHIYILESDEVVNAGATRGNNIFVWTGLLKALPNDADLAVVISHEIAHLLARHTEADPAEEANKLITDVAGMAIGEALRAQSVAGQFAPIAQGILSETLKGFIVNPDSHRLELEADQIGVFILAESGINPEAALRFWSSVRSDARFGGGSFEFFSSHPNSETRLNRLKRLLPEAMDRYRNPQKAIYQKLRPEVDEWEVTVNRSRIYRDPQEDSPKHYITLKKGESITAVCRVGEWLRIIEPYKGFVKITSARPIIKDIDLPDCN